MNIMFRNFSLFTAFACLMFPSISFAGGFWYGFQKYWSGFLADQDGVVMTVLGAGLIGMFIIVGGGKWKK